jgi:hypothetical protein
LTASMFPSLTVLINEPSTGGGPVGGKLIDLGVPVLPTCWRSIDS